MVQLSVEQPLLVVFEDLHWIDPTSLEFLGSSLDVFGRHSVFILATSRPGFTHGFAGHPILTNFSLNRLGHEAVEAIISDLTGGMEVPAELLRIIAERTDGVPLFVEELTKSILESGHLRTTSAGVVLDRPIDQIAIPKSLHDSLVARLDRLQPIKEVAQLAACIGRSFSFRLLAEISPLAASELDTALQGLSDAELIFRRGLPPDSTYLFKHALVRDAAYESLLRKRRQEIHAQIVDKLEQDPDATAEVIAVHAQTAGLVDRAIDLWEKAGRAALLRPALDEAIDHLRQAIKLMQPRLDAQDPNALKRALDLQVLMSGALIARRGYVSRETKAAYELSLAFADQLKTMRFRSAIIYGLWVVNFVGGAHSEALRQAEARPEFAVCGKRIGKTA